MADNTPLALPADQKIARQVLDTNLKKHDLETRLGVIGKVFGADGHSSMNIAGVVVMLLVLTAGGLSVYSFHRHDEIAPVLEIWKIFLAPIMTVLGFVFGKTGRS